MEENVKVVHSKNMPKFNFNLTLNMAFDANANLKKILDVNSYIFDQKVDCGNGKAILTGKVGVKVLYLDTDNMLGTLNSSTNFSETYIDNSITTDTNLNILDSAIANTILTTEGSLKINCDVNISPVSYMNIGLANSIETNDNIISKKNQLLSNHVSKFINTQFEHTLNLETKDKINKILCNNTYFAFDKATAENGFFMVEGKLFTSLVYETTFGEDLLIKELKEETRVKCDVEITDLKKDDMLDLSFCVDKGYEQISTELEDNLSVVTIKNSVKVCGVVLKVVSLDIVDDIYSIENEIETTTTKREYTKKIENLTLSETILNEISLSDNETAIDDIIANVNYIGEVTNSYVKAGELFLEGVISSNLTYIDENKEIKNKRLEVPFVLKTKTTSNNLSCVHHQVSIVDNKIKVKRGTNIEIEYSLFVNAQIYEKESVEIVDSYKIGKKLNLSKYDYQIYIAKQNETMWDLCKRIKIIPSELNKYNKDLPLIMEGGEKIVVKR